MQLSNPLSMSSAVTLRFSQFPHVVDWCWRRDGGTGKSEVVFRIKENLGECVLVSATTGKAAALIDGATVHCSINVPVKPKDKKALCGAALEKLQCRMSNVTHLIIDEFSMINGEFLYWIDQRLQQAKHCASPFGRLSALLAGDPAQLAPMGGTPLWAESVSSSDKEVCRGSG
jgi:hypothetical protein